MPNLQTLEIPSSLPTWQAREALRLRQALETETTEKFGALFWSSVDRPVPLHVFRDAYVATPYGQKNAVDRHTRAAIDAYRKTHTSFSDEEIAEIRANFEPGTVVVDVISGRRIKA